MLHDVAASAGKVRKRFFSVLQVNNPCFVVRAFTPNLGPKKTQNIPVFFEVPAENPQGPWFGTLSISCRGNDVVPFFWDYYLQSSIPEPS